MSGRGGDAAEAKRRLDRFWDTSRDYYAQAQAANPEAAPERRHLLAWLGGDDRVLDLGAGSCENALWLPAGCRYVGFDVSTAALAIAGELGRPGERVRGDGEALPFADGAFDCVVSTWTLCSVGDVGRVLAEVHRVLAPGGRLLYLEHGLSPEAAVARWQRRLGPLQRRFADGCHLDRDFTALLAASPLEAEREERFYLDKVPRFGGYMYRGAALRTST
jgi:SAM-dependent methyltransferase